MKIKSMLKSLLDKMFANPPYDMNGSPNENDDPTEECDPFFSPVDLDSDPLLDFRDDLENGILVLIFL